MIYLSFDIEEFDMPKEYGFDIPFEEQMSISQNGLAVILDLLEKYHCKATFFSTVVFAENSPQLIKRILDGGHELASHTYYHSEFENPHLKQSKEALERISGLEIKGLRMPRMAEVDAEEVLRAGYEYNSSVNPTWLPGRYNKTHIPKRFFKENGVWQIPAAVSPLFRLPLFWLSFHNFPLCFYFFLLKRTVKSTGYAALYFHPWEFSDLHRKEFNFPQYVMKNTGRQMAERFELLLQYIHKNNWKTGVYKDIYKNE